MGVCVCAAVPMSQPMSRRRALANLTGQRALANMHGNAMSAPPPPAPPRCARRGTRTTITIAPTTTPISNVYAYYARRDRALTNVVAMLYRRCHLLQRARAYTQLSPSPQPSPPPLPRHRSAMSYSPVTKIVKCEKGPMRCIKCTPLLLVHAATGA
jgi:hypothetical protein